MLNGAITVFSNATGEAENRFFLDSEKTWNDQPILPLLKSIAKILLSAEINYINPRYINGGDKIGKSIFVVQIILPSEESTNNTLP